MSDLKIRPGASDIQHLIKSITDSESVVILRNVCVSSIYHAHLWFVIHFKSCGCILKGSKIKGEISISCRVVASFFAGSLLPYGVFSCSALRAKGEAVKFVVAWATYARPVTSQHHKIGTHFSKKSPPYQVCFFFQKAMQRFSGEWCNDPYFTACVFVQPDKNYNDTMLHNVIVYMAYFG